MDSKIIRLIKHLAVCASDFTPRIFIFFIIFLFVRLLEIVWAGILYGTTDHYATVILAAFTKDIAFFFVLTFWLYLLYLIIYSISKKAANITFTVTGVILIILQAALIKYFLTALVLLGGDVWGYSFAEIKQTIGAAGGVSFITILVAFFLAALMLSAFIYLPKNFKLRSKLFLLIPLLGFAAQVFNLAASVNDWKPAETEFANSLSVNKTFFFYQQSIKELLTPVYDLDIYSDSYSGDFNDNKIFSVSATFKYTDETHFPFLHIEQTPDVLSPYFNTANITPNIVFIIVEGLGRSFANKGATLGNFTPFLDSLSQHSLYWSNFLSEGGRTFAVLPSIMGSLPFGKNGFAETGELMPRQLNLLNLLKYNGYHSAFYYGGDAHFDNMDIFMNHSAADQVNDMHSFPQTGYSKQPAVNGFSWGYGDKELFRHYLETLPEQGSPRIDVLLTVSMHTPFLINEQQKYLDLAEKRINELSLTETKKSNAEKFTAQYASILYTDDAIKEFIKNYSLKSAFNNTIFVITGDHRMPEIPMENKLERYHVPLIIYSPMLNRSAKFESVSTHYDVAPTLLAYLRATYNISLPSQSSWMGTGLDTIRKFCNTHAYPLMQTKTDLIDFIYDNYLLNGNDLYEIKDNLDIALLNNVALKDKIKAAFDKFKQKNTSVVANAKLIPDSLYQHYQSKATQLVIK